MRASGSGQLGGRRPKKGEGDVRLFKNFSGIRGDSSVAAEARMMLDLWWTLNLSSLKSCLWSETFIETFLEKQFSFCFYFSGFLFTCYQKHRGQGELDDGARHRHLDGRRRAFTGWNFENMSRISYGIMQYFWQRKIA